MIYLNKKQEDYILYMMKKLGRVKVKRKEISKIEAINLELQDKIVNTVYTYEGPPAERRFCRQIQAENKEYTREEINRMSFQGRNKSFGFKGRNYSIFLYKGGVNCKHKWLEFSILRDSNGREYKINNGPADGKAGQVASARNNYWRVS